jgi:hypothetical protein
LEALALVERSAQIESRAQVLADLAEVLTLGARPDEAMPLLDEAVQLYRRKGNTVMAERTATLATTLRESATGVQGTQST